jgi:hypothetical protein
MIGAVSAHGFVEAVMMCGKGTWGGRDSVLNWAYSLPHLRSGRSTEGNISAF